MDDKLTDGRKVKLNIDLRRQTNHWENTGAQSWKMSAVMEAASQWRILGMSRIRLLTGCNFSVCGNY